MKLFLLGCLCTLYLPSVAFAESTGSPWAGWLTNQIYQHPDVVAARETMNATLSRADGRARPLYNPALEAEFEREGQDDNYLVGVNQTVDWQGKRDIQEQQAQFIRIAAKQTFEFAVQQKTNEALQMLIEWQAAKQQSELALRQESQLGTLLELIKGRLLAGDLGQLDAELAYLSLSQKLNEAANAQAQLRLVGARLRELLPDLSSKTSQIPTAFWSHKSHFSSEQAARWVDEHPAVVTARAEWNSLEKSADLARRATKPDPTFGINAGKVGEENVVALTFSVPLNFRNNFSAEARAAGQESLSAEAQYLAVRRKQQFAIEASQAVLQEYRQRFELWQVLMQGRGARSGALLEKQWRSGDLSTAEYLLTLQQRTEGLIAGIELRTQFQLSHIDWLLQTGQVNAALTQLMK